MINHLARVRYSITYCVSHQKLINIARIEGIALKSNGNTHLNNITNIFTGTSTNNRHRAHDLRYSSNKRDRVDITYKTYGCRFKKIVVFSNVVLIDLI